MKPSPGRRKRGQNKCSHHYCCCSEESCQRFNHSTELPIPVSHDGHMIIQKHFYKRFREESKIGYNCS